MCTYVRICDWRTHGRSVCLCICVFRILCLFFCAQIHLLKSSSNPTQKKCLLPFKLRSAHTGRVRTCIKTVMQKIERHVHHCLSVRLSVLSFFLFCDILETGHRCYLIWAGARTRIKCLSVYVFLSIGIFVNIFLPKLFLSCTLYLPTLFQMPKRHIYRMRSMIGWKLKMTVWINVVVFKYQCKLLTETESGKNFVTIFKKLTWKLFAGNAQIVWQTKLFYLTFFKCD
jgi:hypothetical protein